MQRFGVVISGLPRNIPRVTCIFSETRACVPYRVEKKAKVLKKNNEKKSMLRTSKYLKTKNKTIILISQKSFKKLS